MEIETTIISGSKAEGLARYLESDTDYIFVLGHVICLEDGVNARTFPTEITIFRSCMSLPGHCRLITERRGTTIHPAIDDAFCDDGYGRKILSSDLFVHGLPHTTMGYGVSHDRAGPSLPSSLHLGLDTDCVHALRYYCPNILSKWASRPRHWPPLEVVQQVVSLGALLTPVGFKGSAYQHVEWRVCFNAGEIELVNNLNNTQIKMYVLLKMVKADVLKPRKKEISSYTLKNIVLWIAENNPHSLFHEKSLLHWLHEGLDALRVALVTRELPYYMIPDRNLMAACGLEEEQKRKWIATISEMMKEGSRMVLRLPKIRQALLAHPEPFRWYRSRQIELELLLLIGMNRSGYYLGENGVRIVCPQAIERRIKEIVMEVCLRMSMEWGGLFDLRLYNPLDVLKRMCM
ncbi:hypothetical protein DPMN_038977 [Dreissena polymorpha]|uniref:Mab-21-like HhH/H2TH-like domain-containing protein n=1 Tax=Dreissena polymorpha TaxID=45954 RepID=A0A9D4RNR1_DREPO|nr:hypothetical protein DPMN_038977 [Dreissena polymorpha]